MEINQRKEQFTVAYIHAIASVAGYTIYKPDVDDDSVDVGIAASRGTGSKIHAPRLELQLKCTAQHIVRDDYLHFPLKQKNYDDLRDPSLAVPRILVVMLVPNNLDDWVIQTKEALLMRHCCYWYSLRSFPERGLRKSIPLKIPCTQILTVEALRGMITLIGEGGVL